VGLNEVLFTLELAEGQRRIEGAQLFPIGKWRHPRGVISITPERARSFAEQFNRNVAGQKLPILYIHSEDKNVSNPNFGKAAGWITDMRADDGEGVLIDIEFTEAGAEAVRNKEFSYLSAEYFDKVQLPHHDTPQADVVVGAALVNRPHLKGMKPILHEETGHQFLLDEASVTEGGGPVDPILMLLAEQAEIEVSEDAESLSDEQRDAIKQWLNDQAKSLSDATGKIGLLNKRLEELEDPAKAKVRNLAEAGFKEEAALLSEYRADKLIMTLSEALPEGKKLTPVAIEKARKYAIDSDMKVFTEVLEMALAGKATVDLSEKGTSGGGNEGHGEPSEAGDKLVALANAKAKEDSIPWSEAMSLVANENKQLWNEYQLSLGSSKAIYGGEA
jgi:phage I-like protein